jgi:hypothetical protein
MCPISHSCFLVSNSRINYRLPSLVSALLSGELSSEEACIPVQLHPKEIV